MKKNEKIGKSAKVDLMVQFFSQFVPYGSAVTGFYYGRKQEIRFQRIEKFYDEIKSEIDELKSEIKEEVEYDKDDFFALIEQMNDQIETEYKTEKLEYYKNFLKNNLLIPVKDNYDERKYILEILGKITPLQMLVLSIIIKNRSFDSNCGIVDHPFHSVQASLLQLKSYGLIQSQIGEMIMSASGTHTTETYYITRLGSIYYKFCTEVVDTNKYIEKS